MQHLTRFYLVVAIGGAGGGILVVLVAPLVLVDYWEFHLAIIATGLLAFVSAYRSTNVLNATAAAELSKLRALTWTGAILCVRDH